MSKSSWVALLAAAWVGSASALPISGVWEVTSPIPDNSGTVSPFHSVHMKASLTDNGSIPISMNVTAFDLDGVSWLGRGSMITENLSGNQRFRATFRNQSLPDGRNATFELFFRFIWNTGSHTPGINVVTILSTSLYSSSFSGPATATWTVASNPPPIPEPSAMAMMAVGIAGLAAYRRSAGARHQA